MSCNTEIEPQNSSTRIDPETLSTTTQMFVPLAEVAWEFVQNSESRNLVYNEVEKQFDGDDNVLFSKLIQDQSPNGRLIKSETVQKAATASKAFESVDALDPVFPQIYIPFYEELKSSGTLGGHTPVFVLVDGTPSKDSKYQAYSFENGLLVGKGFISEDFATKNEVWVISINERVDSNGNVKEGYGLSDNSGRITGVPSQEKGVTIYGKSNLKEDWVSGGAEVSLSPRILYDGSNTTVTSYFTDNELREAQIDAVVDVSRNNAKNNTFVWASSKYFMKDWDTNSNFINKPYAVYILYEYDPWPAGVHTSSFNGISTAYRSYESPWYTGQAYRSSINCFSINSGGIYFKLYDY